MNGVPAADVVVFVLFVLAAVASNVYTLVYLFRPWRSSRAGQALMVKSLGNTFLLDLGVATLWLGRDFTGRDTIRISGMSLFAAGLWFLLWTLLTSPGAERYPPISWWRRLRRWRARG